MKKTALLLLALSSLAFGAIPSAQVDVSVSATVLEDAPSLIITDDKGTEISAINFHHILQASDSSVSDVLTTNIRAKAAGLTEANSGGLSTNFSNSAVELSHQTNTGNKLTSSLLATPGLEFDNELGAPFIVSSSLSGNNAIVGEYPSQQSKLTITYNKGTTNQKAN
ncbi:MAG: hypothetical protein ACRCYT_07115 [Cetobacterium sp.]